MNPPQRGRHLHLLLIDSGGRGGGDDVADGAHVGDVPRERRRRPRTGGPGRLPRDRMEGKSLTGDSGNIVETV